MDALNDLGMMLRRVAHSLPRDHPQRERIMDLLTKHDLQGSPLRDAAPAAPPAPAADEISRELANLITRDVAEIPDRNSPEDWPEAMIVTDAELRGIVQERVADALTALLRERDALRACVEAADVLRSYFAGQFVGSSEQVDSYDITRAALEPRHD